MYDANAKQCLIDHCIDNPGWKDTAGHRHLICNDFQQSSFSFRNDYVNLSSLEIRGNFSKLSVSSSYVNLHFLSIRSEKLEKFPDSQYGSRREDCEALQSFTKLRYLFLTSGKMRSFRFECLPRYITYVQITYSRLSHISKKSCAAIQQLPALTHLELSRNKHL